MEFDYDGLKLLPFVSSDTDVFNGDISSWQVSKVTDVYSLFDGAVSKNIDTREESNGRKRRLTNAVFISIPYARSHSMGTYRNGMLAL
jgi:Mycoplasma protein of unknown function, DUF285